jgi:hypothetical protein
MEKLNLDKLNDLYGKEQYPVEISYIFSSLESLDDDVDINRAWETIRENITNSAKERLSYYELKIHIRCFDEGCSQLFDQRKQARL